MRMTKAKRAIREKELLLKSNQETIDKLTEDNEELILHISLMKKLINSEKKKK